MFAKGRQEGFDIKAEVLEMYPGLVCRRNASICDIVGYVVYDGDKGIASAASAHEAWVKAWCWVKRKEGE